MKSLDLSGLPDKKELDFSGLPDKSGIDFSGLPDQADAIDLSGLPDKEDPPMAEPAGGSLPGTGFQFASGRPDPTIQMTDPEDIKRYRTDKYIESLGPEAHLPFEAPPEAQKSSVFLPRPRTASGMANDFLAPPAQTSTAGEIKKDIETPIQESFIQPTEVAAAVVAPELYFAKKAGAKLLPAFTRSLVKLIPAETMEFPIGQGAEMAMESENPELALLIAVGVGLGSGLTIERIAEKGLLNSFGKAIKKFPSFAEKSLPKEVMEEYRQTGEFSEWSPRISERMKAKMERRPAKFVEEGQEPATIDFVKRRQEQIQQQAKEARAKLPKPVKVEIPKNIKPFEPELNKQGKPKKYTKEAVEQSGEGTNDKIKEYILQLKKGEGSHLIKHELSGQGGTMETTGLGSGYPEWFVGQGWSSDDAANALEKGLKGEKLGPQQREMFERAREYARDEFEMEYEDFTGSRPPAHMLSVAGVGAGVEQDEDGNWKIDPKKALIGAMVGSIGVSRAKSIKHLGHEIAYKWEHKFAEPFLEFTKKRTADWIVNEELRTALGLARSEDFKELMRTHRREINKSWTKATELGQELAELAPTKVEQKRLLQIIKGGITSNHALAAKAREAQKIFADLKDELKKYNLIQYSQFDKLSRKERAEIRKMISIRDPHKFAHVHDIKNSARRLGLNPDEILSQKAKKIRDVEEKHGVQVKADTERQILLDAIDDKIAFEKSRLQDYYKVGSAEEYAPLYYSRHEGLTPKQREVLQDEIKNLKIKSRRGSPEGRPELESMIAEYEMMLRKGKKGREAFRMGRAKLVGGYAHRREDIPLDVQRAMGLMEEAPYPVAKGIGAQQTDVLKAKLFEDIADNPAWAFRQQKGKEVPKNYTLIENEKFGALSGMYVRDDIWDDLREVEEWRGAFIRNWDKYLGWWKFGKVVLNPATHARNFYSNIILAYMGDVNPADIKTYSRAAKELKNEGEYFKEATDWGLFDNTFYSAEIGKLRDDLEDIRDVGKGKRWIRKAFSMPATMYEGNEKFFKLAVYTKAREAGATVDQAAKKAQKFLFDYSDIPPWVKHAKRWVSPFLTFTYKAMPLFAEQAIKRPWKIAGLMGTIYAAEQMTMAQLGLNKEDYKEKRKALPEWMQQTALGQYTQVLMPFADDFGNDLYLDLAYILPYGNLGESWGQSVLPLSDILPSTPVFKLLSGIGTNTDTFTGKAILPELARHKIQAGIIDGYREAAEAYLGFVWKDLTPSMAPGGYSWNKLKTGIKNLAADEPVTDWAGRPRDLKTAILSSLFGIKLTPVDSEKFKVIEKSIRNNIKRTVSQEINALKRQYQKNEISKEDFETQARELKKIRQLLIEKRID